MDRGKKHVQSQNEANDESAETDMGTQAITMCH
jgi:hypothetical protein